jgi:hypothetical protein
MRKDFFLEFHQTPILLELFKDYAPPCTVTEIRKLSWLGGKENSLPPTNIKKTQSK